MQLSEKTSSTPPIDPLLAGKRLKQLRLRVVLGMLITSILIGTVATLLLYQSQAEQLETAILFEVALQKTAIKSEISRLKNLAAQITSRSRIRQELEKYQNGLIGLDALNAFTRPKLADALRLAPDMVGISRLGNDGRLLIEVGEAIPKSLRPVDFRADSIHLGKPGLVDGRQRLVVSAPIINPKGDKVGIDLVAFDTHRISDTIQDFTRRQKSRGSVQIGIQDPAGVEYYFASGDAGKSDLRDSLDQEVHEALGGTIEKLHIVETAHGDSIIVHQKIDNSAWVLLFFDQANDFYAPARTHAAYVGFSVSILVLIGIFLTLRLVRPLVDHISLENDRNRKLLDKVQVSEERLQSILDNTSSVIYLKDCAGKYLLINRRFEELFHLSREEIFGKTDYEIFPKEAADAFRAVDNKVLETGELLELDEQAPHDDGNHDYLSVKFPLYDAAGKTYGLCGISTDITARKRLEQREQLRLKILEKMAQDEPLTQVLETLVQLVESEMPGALCSVLLLDESGQHLLNGAAPSLPDFYNEAIHGIKVGSGVGSCGTAAYENRQVIVEDIQQHPYWQDYAELAARAGLAACWSEPIRDRQGKILGTFALYYHEPRAPQASEIELITQLAHLAGIAIEHHANEKALRASEEGLRAERDFVDAVVEAAGSIIVVMDRDGKIVRFNHAAEEITGYSFEEIQGQPIWEYLIPAEIREDVEGVFNNLTAGNIVGNYENEWLMKDGSRRLFHWRNTVLQDTDGKVSYVVSQGYDITDIRKTQRALAQHKDKLEQLVKERTAELEEITAYNRTLFETSPIGLVLCDMEGRLVDVNPAYLEIIGYDENEAKTLSYWDITPHDFEQEEALQLQALQESGRYGPYEKEYQHKSGKRVPVRLNGQLIEQHGRQYIWSSVEDISQRRRMENDLRESEANLAQAQTIAHLGSWHLDILSDQLSWSKETYQIFGLEVDSPVSLGNFVAALHLEDTDRVLDAWDAAQLGAPYDIEHRIIADGKEKWVRERAEIHFNDQGQAISVLGTVQDISSLKLAEHATQTALAEAQRLAKVRSDFVANMSHEIRTPLNGVLGLAKMGERGVTTEKAQEIFARITVSGRHLLQVVNDILDFSKIEAGKLVIEKRPVDLIASVDRAASLVKSQVQEKGLSFHLDFADGLPLWVKSDALRLEQILLNLLSNAVKFTQQGEIRLTVEIKNQTLLFRVSDTGVGMAENQLVQLFQPFEQADSSTTRRFGGTGLGLSISINLARMMGGDIQVKSRLGDGSEFILNLPLEPATAVPDAAAQAVPATGQRLKGVRLLAAEDIEVNRLILADLFDQEGAEVVFAEHGQQALDLLQEQGEDAFDVVLMDIQMPVMGGYEATQRIRELSAKLPVIGLTAHALAEEKARCLVCGMVDHVAKPIDADELVNAIQQQVSSSASDLLPHTTAESPLLSDNLSDQPMHQDGDPPVDWEALRKRYRGREGFITKLVQTALNSCKEMPDKLRQAMHAHDSMQLSFLAHGLKGIAGNLEANRLYQLATQVETNAKQGGTATDPVAGELAAALEKVLAALLEQVEVTAE
ncbi:hypothetical protein DJ030_12815 [bacterium endosymbiont of Escarpia laminata]|nr:MAG: hypothetical protein DJ030_12815 [bacterium endosymbiont of Escarpia laminata]